MSSSRMRPNRSAKRVRAGLPIMRHTGKGIPIIAAKQLRSIEERRDLTVSANPTALARGNDTVMEPGMAEHPRCSTPTTELVPASEQPNLCPADSLG